MDGERNWLSFSGQGGWVGLGLSFQGGVLTCFASGDFDFDSVIRSYRMYVPT